MSRSIRAFFAILILGLTFGSGWTLAQQQSQTPVIVSGSDIGFRVDRQRTVNVGKLNGAWVVRVNGEWVEPDTSGTRSLSTK
jgi:hypothetical protein